MTAPSPASIPAPPAGLLQNPQLWADPYPLYKMLRENNPVLRLPLPNDGGAGIWLITRYPDVHATLKGSRFSVDRLRADIIQAHIDRVPPNLLGTTGGLRTMLIMDPPDHTRVRGLVNKAFTPRRVAALRPRIEEIVQELLDAAAPAGRMDLIRDFAEPLPAIVIAELLGVPAENHRQFREWTRNLMAQLDPADPLAGMRRAEKALRPLLDYLRGIIAERRREPRDDLISAMIAAQQERDALTDAELLATSNLILLAGHETTTNLIGNGVLALLRHPEQLARLRREPDLQRPAIEELLRYDSPVQATVRVSTEEVGIGDQTLAPGALVVCGIGAANRDPAAFDDPDRLDLGRADNHHLSFGFGTHFCLGAPLARLEAEVAFAGLLARFPRLSLESEEVRYRPNPALRGLTALPVAF